MLYVFRVTSGMPVRSNGTLGESKCQFALPRTKFRLRVSKNQLVMVKDQFCYWFCITGPAGFQLSTKRSPWSRISNLKLFKKDNSLLDSLANRPQNLSGGLPFLCTWVSPFTRLVSREASQ
jgi:hypothetical protein